LLSFFKKLFRCLERTLDRKNGVGDRLILSSSITSVFIGDASMKKFIIGFSAFVLSIATAIVPASTSSAQSYTFDLSGFDMTSTLISFPSPITAGPGIITGIDYNFSFTAANGSWLRELQIELAAPGATQNDTVNSAGQQVAWQFVTPSNAGTLIWGTPHPEAPGFAPDINMGGASAPGTLDFSGTGESLLNGYSWLTAGDFRLRFADSWNDGPSQGSFNAGSFITIHTIPEPGSLACLSIAAMAGILRRRR